MERTFAGLVGAVVRMRAEIVALRLNQVRRKRCGTIGIEEGKRGGESWRRNAKFDGGLDDVAPRRLRAVDHFAEIGREQEVFRVRIFVERFFNALEEHRADDAAAAPQERDLAVIEVPVVFFCRRLQLDESLRIAADLGGVERLLHLRDEFVAVALERRGRRGGDFFRSP